MSDIIRSDAWKELWFAPLAPYGVPAADRRTFATRSLGHRTLPMPLMLQTRTAPAHYGAVTVGAITQVAETDAGRFGAGTWLDPAAVPEVSRALGLMAGGVAFLSPDLEPGSMVITAGGEDGGPLYEAAVMMGATIVPVAAFDQQPMRSLADVVPTPDGVTFTLRADDSSTFGLSGTTSWRSMPIAAREMKFDADDASARILAWANGSDAKAGTMFLYRNPEAAVGTRARWNLPVGDIIDGRPHLVFHAVYAAAAIMSGAHGGMARLSGGERQKIMNVITEMYQRMAQAFRDPNLQAPWVKRAKLPDHRASVTASAAPLAPPAAWFDGSDIDGPVTVDDRGRVRGLLAPWDVCHTAFAEHGNCVTAPRSATGYVAFTTGTVKTAEGTMLPVGRIVTDTTHPVGVTGASMTASQAAAHYDHTGNQVAIVRAGENRHGIWVAGALVPEATGEQVAKLRRSPLSGDWRDVDGNLELVAALAVNSPGFPVVRLNGGARMALTASLATLERCPQGGDDGVDNGVMTTAPASTETVDATETTETVTPLPAQILGVDEVARLVDAQLDQRAAESARLAAIDAELAVHAAVVWNDLGTQLDQLPKPEGA